MSNDRPTSVVVIGWLWIIFGGLAVLSGLMGILFMIPAIIGISQDASASDIPVWWFLAMVALQLVYLGIAGLGAWAGWAFTQCRSWGRTTLEILSWLAVVYHVGFGIVWFVTIFRTGTSDTTEVGLMIAFGQLLVLVFISIFAVMLYFLRSDDVRAAMA